MPPKDPFPPEAPTRPNGPMRQCPLCLGEGKVSVTGPHGPARQVCEKCQGLGLVTREVYASWRREEKKGR